jgi:membrane fusion protein
MVRQLLDSASANAPQEPVYPVKVAINAQTAKAYGEKVPLQPGMRLEADIQIESRRLIEWIFDPIYSLTGRGQPSSEPGASDSDGSTSGSAQAFEGMWG